MHQDAPNTSGRGQEPDLSAPRLTPGQRLSEEVTNVKLL